MNGPTNHTPKNAFAKAKPTPHVVPGTWACRRRTPFGCYCAIRMMRGEPLDNACPYGNSHQVYRSTGWSRDTREKDRMKMAFKAAINGLAAYDKHDDNHWMKNAVALARGVDRLGGVGDMRKR